MTSNELIILDKIQQTIKDCTKKPEAYLSVQKRLSEDLKNTTKNLYDLAAKNNTFKKSKSNVLPELIVEEFDTEQIWQQLELKNNEEFSRISLGNISKAIASKQQVNWVLPLRISKNVESEKSQETENSGVVEENEEFDSETEDSEDLELEDEEDDTLMLKDKAKKSVTFEKKKKIRSTVVDDKFFKLDELDEFLQKEDKKEFSKHKNTRKVEQSDSEEQEDGDDDDNESIDLFDEVDDEIEEEDEEGIKAGRSLKYEDFFDSPNSDGENFDNEKEADKEEDGDSDFSGDENMFEMDNKNEEGEDENGEAHGDDHDDDDDEMEDDSKSVNRNETKSSLETRKERLQKKIEKLEGEAITDKPWQLKGEISASSRPKDSLLQEFVEFDQVTRPAPVMTEQTTMKLEDIIRKRIKDKAWDDVEKKFKPVETPLEYKKKLIMNQEKSKESLAQIYENEYIKQREALNTDDKEEPEKEEPPEHIEIKKNMHDLFRKLDALTNFHYTPKPAKPEIKIVSNVPAISMEEVAPVATSDATLLAPEEVKTKQKGQLIGQAERTKTDMKRERRKKKLKQHTKAVHESTKDIGKVTLKTLKKQKNKPVLKGRNIINVDQQSGMKDERAIKSSTAFFAHLQDQVVSTIKAKTSGNGPKKSKNTISAVKLKL